MSELTGIKINFDYTGDGAQPSYWSLFQDPKMDLGIFWVKTPTRDTIGHHIPIKANPPETIKVSVYKDNLNELEGLLLENQSSPVENFKLLDAAGFKLVKPADGEFGPFEPIESLILNVSAGTYTAPRIITAEEFGNSNFTLGPKEYTYYTSQRTPTNYVASVKPIYTTYFNIGFYVKKGIPHFDKIVAAFELIAKTGIPSALSHSSAKVGYVGNATLDTEVVPFAKVSLTPLTVSRETVYYDNKELGDDLVDYGKSDFVNAYSEILKLGYINEINTVPPSYQYSTNNRKYKELTPIFNPDSSSQYSIAVTDILNLNKLLRPSKVIALN